MLFAHGYGCDQSMWRWISPAFEHDYRVLLFDLAGSGHAHPSTYDRIRHASLRGYARDVLDIMTELDLHDVVFVGHSVSTVIGILAAIERPEYFARLILVAPSPCYLNREGYTGGFSQKDIDGLIDALDSNYLGWASSLAPVLMDAPDHPQLIQELEQGVCRAHPDIARAFAKVTFLSDNRSDLAHVSTRSLILQVTDDMIAPVEVGRFMQSQLADSELVMVDARGHCPHLSAPTETIDAMRSFLSRNAGHG